jgi:acetolactate synthase-1/2/3 large subunit
MTQQTIAQALAAGLRRHDVKDIFGQSLPSALFLATPEQDIRQVAYRTENAAGVMADAYARISGRIGVVAAQNGPAATLLVAPLAEATKASIPILALVQEVPMSNRDKNAFQEYDHFALFNSCAKWIRRLDDPSRVDDYLDMAMTAACSGRPGPAVLLLPRDVLNQPYTAPKNPRKANLGHFPLDRTRAEEHRIQEAARMIAEARNPIMIAGGGVHASGAAGVVAAIQHEASLPVGTTTMGKGSVDELHPLSIGIVSNYMGKTSAAHHLRDMVKDADVITFVGSRTNENGTDAWKNFAEDATFIHLDVDSLEMGRNYEPDVRLPGDARENLQALREALQGQDLSLRRSSRPAVEQLLAASRTRHALDVGELLASNAVPIRPERLAAEIDAVLAEQDAIVTADASYSSIWVGNYMRSRRPGQRFLTPRGLAGLGWGVPLAIGAKLASPDSVVVSLVGDGGFGHVWSELETAVREEIPIVVVLIDNGILGFQKHVELVQFGAHTTATDFAYVDHAAVARACGAEAACIEDPADITGVLEKAISSGKTWLIEVRCTPDARPPITAWDKSDS